MVLNERCFLLATRYPLLTTFRKSSQECTIRIDSSTLRLVISLVFIPALQPSGEHPPFMQAYAKPLRGFACRPEISRARAVAMDFRTPCAFATKVSVKFSG